MAEQLCLGLGQPGKVGWFRVAVVCVCVCVVSCNEGMFCVAACFLPLARVVPFCRAAFSPSPRGCGVIISAAHRPPRFVADPGLCCVHASTLWLATVVFDCLVGLAVVALVHNNTVFLAESWARMQHAPWRLVSTLMKLLGEAAAGNTTTKMCSNKKQSEQVSEQPAAQMRLLLEHHASVSPAP